MNCPLCGGRVLYHGIVDVECSGPGCANYRPSPEPEYKGNGVGHLNWVECTWQEALDFDNAFPGMGEFEARMPGFAWAKAGFYGRLSHVLEWRCRFQADALRDTIDALTGVSP